MNCFPSLHRGVVAVVVSSLSGCNATDPACPSRNVDLPITLAGDFGARGSMQFARTTGGGLTVAMKLSTPGSNGSTQMFELAGTGECANGVMRIRLAGGPTIAGSTLLGVEVEGLYGPTLGNREFFGAWSADLADGRGAKHTQGFVWHERKLVSSRD